MQNKSRYFEVLVDGRWVERDFMQLRGGDVFRVWQLIYETLDGPEPEVVTSWRCTDTSCRTDNGIVGTERVRVDSEGRVTVLPDG